MKRFGNFFIIACFALCAVVSGCEKGENDDDGGGGNGKGKVWVDKKGGKTQTYANLDAALLPLMQSGPGEYTIRIGENQHITSNFNYFAQKEQTITLKAESGTVEITRSSDLSHHFWVQLESTLILEKGITLKGYGYDDEGYPDTFDEGIWVDRKGKLIMNEGVKLTGFGHAAIFISNGIFEMNGGTICDNVQWGVDSDNEWEGSVFIMNGGSISDNGVAGNATGVHIGSATFTMNNGTISGNATGGVMVYPGGTFIMKNGRIINNRVEYYGSSGGGVDVLRGTFTMEGGEISGNKATYGGGVSVVEGTFTMTGGIIAKNTATSLGGGIELDKSSIFSKTGNSIIYGVNGGTNANISEGDGHAAYISGTYPTVKRDLTAGEGVVMRWSENGSKVGWDN